MKRVVKRWLTGLSVPQEYVCLPTGNLGHLFRVCITLGEGNEVEEVTTRHIFLGYSPLLIGLIFPLDETIFSVRDDATLLFKSAEFDTGSTALARLDLVKVEVRILGGKKIVFYRGVKGEHRLIAPFYQKVNAALLKFRSVANGFIQLEGNLYEQVRIAYSIPREISLICVGNETRLNIFPTDLHGPVDDACYISSLRIGGEACKQVEQHKKIVLVHVGAEMYKEVYAMGKNHQRQMAPVSAFKLYQELSAVFRIPLPANVCSYLELEGIDFFDRGIHRIFIYRIVNQVKIRDAARLSHIHNYAVQWRMNNGLKTDYLLR
jgi:flavin reductase (DIM6/NTAB) family NADH-FMN oxidoreductase RutF